MVPTNAVPMKRAKTSPSDADAVLAARAVEAYGMAHSPYSGVRVGAAIASVDGRVFTGCNVENASYGLTICAERTALVKAISEGARTFTTLAVASDRAASIPPCGACRQCLAEFAPDLRILLVAPDGSYGERSLRDLLPEPFGAAHLG